MWKAAAGTIAFAAVIALGGVANANKGDKQETNLEKQSGSEAAVDLKKVRGEHAKKIQEKLKEEGFYQGEIDGVLGANTKEALRKFQEAQGLEASGKLDNQTASALGIEMSDIQPVRGEEEKKYDEKKKMEHEMEPAESPTPMTDPQSGTESEPMTSPTPSEELETQSGTETGEDSTSPVTGGDTATEETEPTSGQTQGGEPTMGGVEAQEDPNVVNEEEIEQQAGTTFDKETIRKVQQALKDQNLFKGEVNGEMNAETQEAIRQHQEANGLPVTGQLDASVLQSLGVSMPSQMTPTPTQQ